ncbi:hypothetical protein OOK29_25790 [Streptomyces phaeochromogenes]|uniref:hypothetical protein n=1 Tax=Streptomyces phaeochromogenes TaxID=1923 RepID=UPI00225BAEF1|nr:hypothetical protein [Streptomyces phaeochromogenes]MCX5601566.1 hypothetical protein [Streptomyces phaeochromogenes]
MTEPTPDVPAVDLASVFGAPAVTLLARADEVKLGDVIDTVDGLVRVREIVQRQHVWDLAGDRPGHIVRRPAGHRWGTPDVPPLHRRSLARTTQIRVRRTARDFGRLTGHAKKVASHDPVKRGWYTDPGGYDAACSCGWKHPDIFVSKGGAADGWLAHKAGQISEAAYADNPALLWLSSVEVVHPALPTLPWSFRKIRDRPKAGDGIAAADLDMLTVTQARAVMSAWRAVIDVDDQYTFDDHRTGPVNTIRGERPGWTSLRLSGTATHTRIILDAHIDDPAPQDTGGAQ